MTNPQDDDVKKQDSRVSESVATENNSNSPDTQKTGSQNDENNEPVKTEAKKPDAKKETTKPPPRRKATKKKTTSPETKKPKRTAQSKSKKQANKPKKSEKEPSTQPEKSRLVDITENVEEGAKLVGEKASKIAGTIFDSVKQGISSAYKSSTRVVEELSHSTHDYVDKYKGERKMKRLTYDKDVLAKELGVLAYEHYQEHKEITPLFFEDTDIGDLLKKISQIDRKIVSVGRKLDETRDKDSEKE